MFGKFSRRQFASLAGLSALGLTGPAEAANRASRPDGTNFPTGFVWGTATSSYQVEGAVNEDGRGPSIWDTFTHTSGKIEDGSTGDRANDHYHRYKEDVRLIKELGARAYRFSIAWPRVFPDGTGAPNPKGLDFYNRLVDELLANGIEPYATLYHWDLPQALQDRVGGWRSRDTSKAFGDYAGYVAQRLTDRVKNVFTLNEVGRFLPFGYALGVDAPGLKLPAGEVNQARHHVALAHGLAVQAIRAKGRAGTRVGPAENITACVPAFNTPENIRATEIATRELNAGFLGVVLEGKYTEGFLQYAGADAPKFTADELKIIAQPNDFVGLNIYAPQCYILATDNAPGWKPLPMPASFPHMSSEWLRIAPETIYWAPRIAAKLWNIKSIYISENGTSGEDRVHPDGQIYDLDRIMFLRNYLAQLQRATADGVPVHGYFLWSLMDNFEWIFGYEKRFGLYRVDFETQARVPKLSAAFYRDVIARNAIGV
ncbi:MULTISPECIES: GH1 family beta-glucosidase [Bradyrhizobium]|jgi:beta-glucosidase|uniref:GH1 family beta-glucosidase n=1 Tax=Bradyrhizobium TaxID=374 RepID=UPI0004890B1C|nr:MULTISPECIES: GH1 family beta-glucosidase [Bradyrhizobium]MCS3446972.1 beta-glucosidase [Bradyrhizobium elkanii]MCS3561895.1 beta-glucosidase [Bradyrhizobium elkanii]MCW2148267.1 beta-glucosidase [Bradyrhizobium elkanii]MCW2352646.1 beta-glucosidase [Bradyrhizobium elkanii]MCW2371993.1 beta-glucosidase [Bradyrhizobium elkanii]